MRERALLLRSARACRAGEGAGECSQSGARAVSGHTTGWRGAVARAAWRFCLRRQSDLEPVGLFWATGLGSQGLPIECLAFRNLNTKCQGPPVGGLPARKAIKTERMGRHHTVETSPLSQHDPNRDPGWGLEGPKPAVPTTQVHRVGCPHDKWWCLPFP